MIAQLNPLYIKTRPRKVWSRLISYALFEGRPLTTKGRWINPLVFAHFAFEKRLPQLKKVKKPIFIVGTGRSGSTILGMVMSMHKHVGFLNEPKALWHSIYAKEDLIGNYSADKAHYRLCAEDATDDVKRFAHRLFGIYLVASFSKRVIDKYPELITRVPFVKAIFPDAKFLFLVRNGMDCAISIDWWSQRHGIEKEHEIHDWWGFNNRKWKLLMEQIVSTDPAFTDILDDVKHLKLHIDKAIVEWITMMREGLSLLESIPDSVMMVRFEKLTKDPSNVLRDILQFCELPGDQTFLDYGCRVLYSVPSREQLDIHPSLRSLFNQTMKSLGYETATLYT